MAKSETAFDLASGRIAEPYGGSHDGLAQWLCRELDIALSVRSARDSDLRYAWALYEQQRTRIKPPWPGAADLTSPLASEYVDSLCARLMTMVFTDPVWTVEGFGPSAKKAPFVEEVHQRAQEDERLQGYVDIWVQRAMVEGVGTLEVSENTEMRRERRRASVTMQTDETGNLLLGDDGQPQPVLDDGGRFVEAEAQSPGPTAEMDLDELTPVRVGPAYDVVPYQDFCTLPAHARSKDQVWGYAKRFWRRVPELKARGKQGVYAAAAVEALGTHNERDTAEDDSPRGVIVPDQKGPTAQKELYEVQFLADLDGQGERWWRATVSREHTVLLRLKHDDRTTRYVRFIPFPKANTIDHGYSLVVDKLITVIEEDTAVRNIRADRAAMKAAQPIKRLVGALWDPYEQPFGPGAVIDVRSMDEVQPMQGIEDVSASVMHWKNDVRADAERLIGQNEIAQGQTSAESRTLGEVQLQASYAEVRMNLILKRLAEPMEELGQIRHLIIQKTLASNPSFKGRRWLSIGQDARGIDVPGIGADGSVTAELLDGQFWFRPKGSVETADVNRQRADMVQLLQALAPVMQINPSIAAVFQTVPAARSLTKQLLRVFRWPDIYSFLGDESRDVFAVMQEQQEQQRAMQQAMADPRMQLLMGAIGAPDQPVMAPAAPSGPAQAAAPQANVVPVVPPTPGVM